MTVQTEFVRVIILLLTGATLAFLLDLYRAWRSLQRPGLLGTLLGDLMYMLLVASITSWVLIFLTWGEIRVLYFIFIVMGLLWYRVIFKYRLVIIMRGFWRTSLRGLDTLLRRLGKVLVAIGTALVWPFVVFFQVLFAITRFIGYSLHYPLKFFGRK